jgi:hypothetical protein
LPNQLIGISTLLSCGLCKSRLEFRGKGYFHEIESTAKLGARQAPVCGPYENLFIFRWTYLRPPHYSCLVQVSALHTLSFEP